MNPSPVGDDAFIIDPSGEARFVDEKPVDGTEELAIGEEYLPSGLPLSIGDYKLVSWPLEGASCQDQGPEKWEDFTLGGRESAEVHFTNQEGLTYLNTLDACADPRVAIGSTNETHPGLIQIIASSNEPGEADPHPVCRTGEIIVACTRHFGETWWASAAAGRGGATEPSEAFLASFLEAFINNTSGTREPAQH